MPSYSTWKRPELDHVLEDWGTVPTEGVFLLSIILQEAKPEWGGEKLGYGRNLY